MRTSATRAARRQPVIVLAQSAQRHRWEVAVGHGKTSQFFADRELALSYTQIWASVNLPSMVRLSGYEWHRRARMGVRLFPRWTPARAWPRARMTAGPRTRVGGGAFEPERRA
jgi:hypothetical protein